MSTRNVDCKSRAGNSARARGSVETAKRRRNLLTLGELLATDLRLFLRLRAVDITLTHDVLGYTGRNQTAGESLPIRVPSRAVDHLAGYDVMLLGRVVTDATGGEPEALPAQIAVTFSRDGKIRRMTIAVADPHALTAALRNAAHEAQ
jgi:hypothetical protein